MTRPGDGASLSTHADPGVRLDVTRPNPGVIRLKKRADFLAAAKGRRQHQHSFVLQARERDSAPGADETARARVHRHQESRQFRRPQPHPPPPARDRPARRRRPVPAALRLCAGGAARSPGRAFRRFARRTRPRAEEDPSGRREPASRRSGRRPQARPLNMQQDSRNLVIAMGLSLLVILGWNHFYGAPKVQQARQTLNQLNQLDASRPGAAGEPGQRRRRPAADPRGGARREQANRAGDAQPVRLDRAQGRASRRRLAAQLSRDHRPQEPQHRPAVAVGRAGRLFRRFQLCRAAWRDAEPAVGRHFVDRRQRQADPGDPRHPDLRQRQWPRFQAQGLGGRVFHVHRGRHDREQEQGARHLVPELQRDAPGPAQDLGLCGAA